MHDKKELSAFREYISIILDWGTIVGIFIGLFYGLLTFIPYTATAGISFFNAFYQSVIIPVLGGALLSILIINIPNYNRKKTNNLIKEIDIKVVNIEELVKVELSKCSRMTALHTDGNILTNQLKRIDEKGIDDDKMNLKWIMAKYLSKLLSVQLIDYTFHLSASNYFKFASDIIKESRKSIVLLGSLTPMTWLSILGDDDEKIKKYFNNALIEQFPINEDNHSITLNNLSGIKKQRYICLNDQDFNTLYIHENSIVTYHKINHSIESYFINIEKAKVLSEDEKLCVNPLLNEYMICDNEIAFEWNPTSEMVKISENIVSEKDFLKHLKSLVVALDLKVKKNREANHLNHLNLIKKIRRQKIEAITDCIDKKMVMHKYSYMFPESLNLMKNIYQDGNIYGGTVLAALGKVLPLAVSKKNNKVNIIHIGPGSGHRISGICDLIGSNNICGYYPVDYSPVCLQKAMDVLKNRLSSNEPKVDIKSFQIDLYEDFIYDQIFRNSSDEVIKNAIVLIPANSSLLGHEVHEEREDFLSKLINVNNSNISIITLDRYDPDTFKKIHLPSKEFIFSPLKVFEVPYISELASNNFFSHEYPINDDENNIMRINFKLKEYIKKLDGVMLNKYSVGSDEDEEGISLANEYYTLRKKFYAIDYIQLVSFLKFENVNALKSHFNKSGFQVEIDDNILDTGDTFCFTLKAKTKQ